MKRPNKRHAQQKRMLYSLLFLFPFLAGCGLGWLYMRVGDSQRIKATKMLTFDSTKDRFANAKKLYEKAIDNYRESIMYDDIGNPMVFHKLGYTIMLLPEVNLNAAEAEFKEGLKRKRGAQAVVAGSSGAGLPQPSASPAASESGQGFRKDKQDTSDTPASSAAQKPIEISSESRSDEEIQVDNDLAVAENITDSKKKDEDLALMYAGMGLVHFLRGIQFKKEDEFRVATKYYKLADKWSTHPSWTKKASTFSKVLASLDLEEIVDPAPHLVMEARVHNYWSQKYAERGQGVLAESELTKAADALDQVKVFYEREPRFLAELAQMHFQRKEYDKCEATIKSIKGTQGYADLKVTNTLLARALIEQGRAKGDSKKIDEANLVINELLDREPEDHRAMLLRGWVYAFQKNYTELKSTVDTVFANAKASENPQLMMEAGDIYASLGEDDAKKSAKNWYQKAFYIIPKDIRVNYLLGKAYHALGDTGNMKECFGRTCKIDPSSSYCKEVAPLIQ